LTAGYKQIEQNIKAIQLVNTNESQRLELVSTGEYSFAITLKCAST